METPTLDSGEAAGSPFQWLGLPSTAAAGAEDSTEELLLTLCVQAYLEYLSFCYSRTHKELNFEISYCIVDNKLFESKNIPWVCWGGEKDWLQSYIMHNSGTEIPYLN